MGTGRLTLQDHTGLTGGRQTVLNAPDMSLRVLEYPSDCKIRFTLVRFRMS